MQVNDRVVCVYASDCLNLTTHGTYIVDNVYVEAGHELNLDIVTLEGKQCGTYNHRRFMLESDVIKQVLENARNDR